MREYRGGVHQLAGRVDHSHFHASADAGVQTHHHARPGRGGQQQVAQIVRKHLDRYLFSVFTQLGKQVALGGHAQLHFPRPAHAFTDQIVGSAALVAPAQAQCNAAFG